MVQLRAVVVNLLKWGKETVAAFLLRNSQPVCGMFSVHLVYVIFCFYALDRNNWRYWCWWPRFIRKKNRKGSWHSIWQGDRLLLFGIVFLFPDFWRRFCCELDAIFHLLHFCCCILLPVLALYHICDYTMVFLAFRCIGDWSNQRGWLCNFSKVTFTLIICVLYFIVKHL